MRDLLHNHGVILYLKILIAAVWLFHGCYSKLFNGIPRHRQIVGKILGPSLANPATKVVGGLEVLLGFWVLAGWWPVLCAAIQTAALVAMNVLEISLAAELLISPAGMAALNLGFIVLIWCWACFAPGR